MLHIPLRKLEKLRPEPTDLDQYETASTQEIRALQRERMVWSLRHAYENVPHYPNASSIADQRNSKRHGTLSRQRLRRKTTILNRSAQLFFEHGYGRASMNKIAESCGVSKATLYHYYKDKEGLLFDVIRFHLKELLEVVEEANRSEQSIAALRSSFLRRLGETQTFFKLGKQEDKHLTFLARQ